MKSIDQKIAEKEAELARLREKSRALENGQKIILGGMVLAAAKEDAKIRAWLLREAEKSITREVDQKRLAPLLDALRRMPEPAPGSPAPGNRQAPTA
jgi:hypothetical protein